LPRFILLVQFNNFSFGSSSAKAFRSFVQGSKPALIVWEGVVDSAFCLPSVGIFVVILALAFAFLFPLRGLQQQQQEMALLFGRSSPARDYDFCMLARDIPEHACFYMKARREEKDLVWKILEMAD
jgi:hypothetical protein